MMKKRSWGLFAAIILVFEAVSFTVLQTDTQKLIFNMWLVGLFIINHADAEK